ncbi:hypothetical protein CBR_g52136 [Chara braunii]|uniref:Uncharacterized protein n=1 Tax=Chara braunii TaxID=69332 RepID=A0A388M9M1_CHABU|nr:hypothetical protein CBR_g52136 [Chara braunii]|eukprot:GBG91250.1 hypothetical protein CBR_g52136 [Chara braunii]
MGALGRRGSTSRGMLGRMENVFPLETWLGHSEDDIFLRAPRGGGVEGGGLMLGGGTSAAAETAKAWAVVRSFSKQDEDHRRSKGRRITDGSDSNRSGSNSSMTGSLLLKKAVGDVLMALHGLRRNRFFIPIGNGEAEVLVGLLRGSLVGADGGSSSSSRRVAMGTSHELAEVQECCLLLLHVWVRRAAVNRRADGSFVVTSLPTSCLHAAVEAARLVLRHAEGPEEVNQGGRSTAAAMLFLGGVSTAGRFCTKELRQACQSAVVEAMRMRPASILRSGKLPVALSGVGYLLYEAHGQALESLVRALVSLWSSSRRSQGGTSAIGTAKSEDDRRADEQTWRPSLEEGRLVCRLLEYEGVVIQRRARAQRSLNQRMIGLADARVLAKLVSAAVRCENCGDIILGVAEEEEERGRKTRRTGNGQSFGEDEILAVRCASAMALAGLLRGFRNGVDARSTRSQAAAAAAALAPHPHHTRHSQQDARGGLRHQPAGWEKLSDWDMVAFTLEDSLRWVADEAASTSLISVGHVRAGAATGGLARTSTPRIAGSGMQTRLPLASCPSPEETQLSSTISRSQDARNSCCQSCGDPLTLMGVREGSVELGRQRCWRRFVAYACTLYSAGDAGSGLRFTPAIADLLTWFLLEECLCGLDWRLQKAANTMVNHPLGLQRCQQCGSNAVRRAGRKYVEGQEGGNAKGGKWMAMTNSFEEDLRQHVAGLVFREAGVVTRALCEQYRQVDSDVGTQKRIVTKMMAYAQGLHKGLRLYYGLQHAAAQEGLMGVEQEEREGAPWRSLGEGPRQKGEMAAGLRKLLEASFLAVSVVFERAFVQSDEWGHPANKHVATNKKYGDEPERKTGTWCRVGTSDMAAEALDALSCMEFFRVYYGGYKDLVQRLFDVVTCEQQHGLDDKDDAEQDVRRGGVGMLMSLFPSYKETVDWPGWMELVSPVRAVKWTEDLPHSARVVFYMQVLAQCMEMEIDVFADRIAPTVFLYLHHPRKQMAMAAHQLFSSFLQWGRSVPPAPPPLALSSSKEVESDRSVVHVESLSCENDTCIKDAGDKRGEGRGGEGKAERKSVSEAMALVDFGGQVIPAGHAHHGVEGDPAFSLKEQLAGYYVTRALEGLHFHVTPYEGLTIGYASIVRHLPAGSLVIVESLRRLVCEAAVTAKSSFNERGTGSEQVAGWLARQPPGRNNHLQPEGGGVQQQKDSKNHRAGLADTGMAGKQQAGTELKDGVEEEEGNDMEVGGGVKLELPAFLQALVFVLVPLVDVHVLPGYLAMVSSLVEEMAEPSWQAAALAELFGAVTDSHDYTRKPVLVEWYLRLKHKVGRQREKGAKAGRSGVSLAATDSGDLREAHNSGIEVAVLSKL